MDRAFRIAAHAGGRPAYACWVDADRDRPWEPLSPWQALRLLAGLSEPWWVAGGWALDLAAGRATRSHADLDLGVFRGDLPAVFEALPGFDFFGARGGALRHATSAGAVGEDVHSIWCRRRRSGLWTFELMLDERLGDSWVFRRDRSIRRPVSELVQQREGAPAVLCPEVQLLYKAKQVRDRDEQDFRVHAPGLDPQARGWLRDALARVHPGHRWLRALEKMRP